MALMLAAVVVLAGCGSGKTALVVPDPSATTGLPTPATAGTVNTYTGPQTPGKWSFTLDNTNDVFSYQPVTYSATATTGTTTTVNGFTALSNGGYALEIEGRAAILRPGDSTNAPVFGVPQTECYPITGKLRFQYLDTRGGGYGSIVASTDTTGASWAFEDLEGIGTGPASFTATCSTSSNLSTIGFTAAETLLDDDWYSFDSSPSAQQEANAQKNIWIGPTGFFVADQSDPTGIINGTTTITPTGSSVVGVAEPTSALSASDIASKSYRGFLYEPGIFDEISYQLKAAAPTITVPVSFTGLTGEAYLNNDVTQALDSTTTTIISLGTQDSTYNGLYQSVSITVLDPSSNCVTAVSVGTTGITTGVNSGGYITCTFSGTAIVGNPGGKYAIFVTADDWATYEQSQGGAYHMQLYLFQQ
ncbi:hypothetical protein ACOBR2_08540 [Telmatobacter bradus]|uniref:hypothetical protein n=1 Tax=Telmatobacter bradus TaxID=474953 RepID=UPI003B43712A